MTKETISQSQQGNAVSVSTNQNAISTKCEANGETKKVPKKEEQHFKNEFMHQAETLRLLTHLIKYMILTY